MRRMRWLTGCHLAHETGVYHAADDKPHQVNEPDLAFFLVVVEGAGGGGGGGGGEGGEEREQQARGEQRAPRRGGHGAWHGLGLL